MTKSIIDRQFNTLPKFDSDSFLIGIDNHSSKCISPKLSDFIHPIKPSNGVLKGISGKLSVYGTGTVVWKVLDDDGVKHSIQVKDCLYVPEAPMRLLSPQQWSQQMYKSTGNKSGTWYATYSDKCMLHWNSNSLHKTILLDSQSNVAIMRSAPGFAKYFSFSSVVNQFEGNNTQEKVREIDNPHHQQHQDSYHHDTSMINVNHDSTSDSSPSPDDILVATKDQSELMR